VVERFRKTWEWKHESAIHPEFARRIRLIERCLEDPHEVSPPSARMRRCMMVNATSSFAGSSEAEMGAAAGIDIRDPTADARLLNFCLSVPDEVFTDPATGTTRWLIREAMKGRLPDNVRLNRRRGRQAADLVPRLRRSAEEVESVLTEIENGRGAEYVSVPAMRAAWERILTRNSPEALKLSITMVTRGIMAGLFVDGFGQKW
jgi:asparagine synthase (glutamine-hydrolysing)